jgi:hypothetical protein
VFKFIKRKIRRKKALKSYTNWHLVKKWHDGLAKISGRCR